MPRPPVLPTLNWQEIFEAGLSWGDWLSQSEFAEKSEKMSAGLKEQYVPPQVEAYLKGLPKAVYVVAIAEGWCGDVVRHAPVLQKMGSLTSELQLRFIAREQYPDVFARFLTNGGEAIPKFIFLSDQFVECGNWGPLPEACRELIARGKACGDVGTAREKVSALYAADPDKQIVLRELLHLIDIAASERP